MCRCLKAKQWEKNKKRKSGRKRSKSRESTNHDNNEKKRKKQQKKNEWRKGSVRVCGGVRGTRREESEWVTQYRWNNRE